MSNLRIKLISIATGLILILALFSCNSTSQQTEYLVETNKFLDEKSEILQNYVTPLKKFAEISCVLCGDEACLRANSRADSILNTIDLKGSNYYHDLSKIYSAMTHSFFGISYLRIIFASISNPDLLKESAKIIIQPINDSTITNKALLDSEIDAYNALQFFLVLSNFEGADLYERSNNYDYISMSIEQKHPFFLSFFSFWLTVAHDKSSLDEVTSIAYKFDDVLDKYSAGKNITEKEYWSDMVKLSSYQKELLDAINRELQIEYDK